MDPVLKHDSVPQVSRDQPFQRDNKGLYQRTVKSGLWLVALDWSTKLLGVVSLFVLTNLLGSAQWGLLGIASLVISTLGVFTQTGFSAALIQKRDDSQDYLDTAWTIELLRGVMLCVILWMAAPWASLFFDQKGYLEPSHLQKPTAFIRALRDEDRPLSAFLRSGLSSEVRSDIDSLLPTDPVPPVLLQSLCQDLNHVLTGDGWDNPDLTSGISLSGYTQKLKRQSSIDPVRLHRRILQDAYPGWISQAVMDRDTVEWIIRILSLLQVIGALGNIGTLYFRKDLQFHRDFIFRMISSLSETVITITLAFLTRSVWSLVWGKVLGVILKTIFSYYVHPFRPHIRIEWTKAWDLWKYGQWIFVVGILGYFQVRGDQLFVGKMLGPVMFGLYALAMKLSQAPATEVSLVIAEVTFPAYSKLQDDIPRLREAYLKVLRLTAFITVPISGLIIALGADFVHVFFNSEWWPIIPVMQILSIKGLTHSLHTTFSTVYRAIGKPVINAYLQLIRLVLLVILICPFVSRWGILGAGMTMVSIALIMQPLGYYLIIRVLRCGLWSMLSPIVYPMIAMVIMVGTILLTRGPLFCHHYNLLSLVVLGTIGILVYLGSILIMDTLKIYRVRPLLTEVLITIVRKQSNQEIRSSSLEEASVSQGIGV